MDPGFSSGNPVGHQTSLCCVTCCRQWLELFQTSNRLEESQNAPMHLSSKKQKILDAYEKAAKNNIPENYLSLVLCFLCNV